MKKSGVKRSRAARPRRCSKPHRRKPHSGVEPLLGVKLDRGGFARLPLTAEQWSKTTPFLGIAADNDEVRRQIEITLGLYRKMKSEEISKRKPTPEIREEFLALKELARNLYRRLDRLTEHDAAYEAITLYHPERLSQTLAMLSGLPKYFVLAAHNVKDHTRGPKADNVYWLVAQLDGIREQLTGKKITRSYKDAASKKYIEHLCKIADPQIGSGTIDNAMKERIKTRVD